MQRLTSERLQELLASQATPAVTIYIPMHTTASPPHITENQLRLKNNFHAAAALLRKRYDHAADQLAETLEAYVVQLHDDLSFWEAQTPALLVCADNDAIQLFHLPIDTEEYLAIDEHFHLAPLMGLLHDQYDFYVLNLAQQNPKLLFGNAYDLEDSAVQLPKNINDALDIDEPNRKTENQGTASRINGTANWFNGRGGARDPAEADRMRYFRLIDKTIADKADTSLPLILCGPEAELAQYRKLSKYPHILQESIAGNHTLDDPRVLFQSASQIVWRELIAPSHQMALEEYQRVGGSHPDRVMQDSAAIDEAAKTGRVDKLLAPLSRQTTDTIRDRNESVFRLSFPAGAAATRLNNIARAVWQNSGTVFNLFPEEMPQGATLAARLRY